MFKFILIQLVKWFTGLSKDQFNLVIERANYVEHTVDGGGTKAVAVGNFIKTSWAHLPDWAVNLLRELAVAWLRKVAV